MVSESSSHDPIKLELGSALMLFDWKLWRNPKLKRRLKTLSFPRIRFKQSLGKSLWSDLVVRPRSSTFSSPEKGWESQFIVLRIKWLIAVMTRSLISSVRDVSTDVSKRFFLYQRPIWIAKLFISIDRDHCCCDAVSK